MGSKFEAIVLGAGDAFSAVRRTASLLLVADGFHLAIDCPDGYRRVLRDVASVAQRELDFARIDDVLITHVHGDHMNGLEAFAFFKFFVEHKPVRLFTNPDARAVMWNERLKAPMEQLWNGTEFRSMRFDDYFAYTPLAWETSTSIGPFTVRTRRTIHHVPTSALLIEHGGRTLGYSSDTAFDPQLIEFLSRADLIIHETNYGPAHTPYASLAELPPDLRARMRLIHYPDELDIQGSAIRCVREGEILIV